MSNQPLRPPAQRSARALQQTNDSNVRPPPKTPKGKGRRRRKTSARMVIIAIIVGLCFTCIVSSYVLSAFDKDPVIDLSKTLAVGGPLSVIAWLIGVGFDHHTANVHGKTFDDNASDDHAGDAGDPPAG